MLNLRLLTLYVFSRLEYIQTDLSSSVYKEGSLISSKIITALKLMGLQFLLSLLYDRALDKFRKKSERIMFRITFLYQSVMI